MLHDLREITRRPSVTGRVKVHRAGINREEKDEEKNDGSSKASITCIPAVIEDYIVGETSPTPGIFSRFGASVRHCGAFDSVRIIPRDHLLK